jgi:hypothetical protein
MHVCLTLAMHDCVGRGPPLAHSAYVCLPSVLKRPLGSSAPSRTLAISTYTADRTARPERRQHCHCASVNGSGSGAWTTLCPVLLHLHHHSFTTMSAFRQPNARAVVAQRSTQWPTQRRPRQFHLSYTHSASRTRALGGHSWMRLSTS